MCVIASKVTRAVNGNISDQNKLHVIIFLSEWDTIKRTFTIYYSLRKIETVEQKGFKHSFLGNKKEVETTKPTQYGPFMS